MKKMLMVASVASMIGQFNMANIQLLQSMGYQVEVACDFQDRSVWPEKRIQDFCLQLQEMKIPYHQIDFSRNALNIRNHCTAYIQMKKIVKSGGFDFIHCHTPIAGVISRLVAQRCKVKIIYTAHGFHFFKGAPLKNWMSFYPIEWICSWMTDVLITITKEDYERANRHLHAKKSVYVPGVGIDIEKFRFSQIDIEEERNEIRLVKLQELKRELHIEKDAFILLSVGELNSNKNHSVVISALAKCENENIHYCIAGTGELENELNSYAEQLGIASRVHLLGFRNDIPDLLKMADIYLLPSIREGLNVSLMEAMASGLPAICLDIRGNRDLIVPGKGGFLVKKNDPNEFSWTIDELLKSSETRKNMAEYNAKRIRKFDQKEVARRMRQIYTQI